MIRPFTLTLSFMVLALFGFGCKEPSYNQAPSINWRGMIQGPSKSEAKEKSSPKKQLPSKRSYDKERVVTPDVLLLREAFRNLARAKSFRANLILPAGTGQSQPTQGEIIFDHEKGLRGKIIISPTIKSDLLLLKETVYFRSGTSTWQDITNTAEADRLQHFFRVAFPGEMRPNQVFVSDSARVLEVKDDPLGCKRYTFDEIMPNGEREQTMTCLQNNVPIYIINQYAEGSTEVRYRDLNQPVEIGGLDES